MSNDEHHSQGKGLTFLSTDIAGGPTGGLPPADAEPPLIADAIADRNHWIRLFNRLENAVRRHEEAKTWTDDADDALHAAHRSVLKTAHSGDS